MKTRQDREWKWVFCWIISVQVVSSIATNVIQAVQCQPVSALWNDDVAAQCWPPERTQLAAYVTLGEIIIALVARSVTDVIQVSDP